MSSRGFTLIELLVAIAILAVVALLSWRGFDQLVRGREIVVAAMQDERGLSLVFDQMGADLRAAATDDEALGSAVAVGGGDAASGLGSGPGSLTIVRTLAADPGAGQPVPRLQVVRYRVTGGQLVREASAPLATVGALRLALRGNGPWSTLSLLDGVRGWLTQTWLDTKGWTDSATDIAEARSQAMRALRDPALADRPLPRAVQGVRVMLNMTGMASGRGRGGAGVGSGDGAGDGIGADAGAADGGQTLAQPYTRIYLVGQ